MTKFHKSWTLAVFAAAASAVISAPPAKAEDALFLQFSHSSESLGSESIDSSLFQISYAQDRSGGAQHIYGLSFRRLENERSDGMLGDADEIGLSFARTGPLNERGLSYTVGFNIGQSDIVITDPLVGPPPATFDMDGEYYGLVAALSQFIPLGERQAIVLTGGAQFFEVRNSIDVVSGSADITVGFLQVNYVHKVGDDSYLELGVDLRASNEVLNLSDDKQAASVSIGYNAPMGAGSPYRFDIGAETDVTGEHDSVSVQLGLRRAF